MILRVHEQPTPMRAYTSVRCRIAILSRAAALIRNGKRYRTVAVKLRLIK